MSAPAGVETALRERRGDELTRLLLEAPATQLEAALENPALEEDQLLLALRRPDLGAELARRVAESPRWAGSYLVKSALVSHPHTPKVIALNLVKYLFWRDLARLVANFQVSPAVRRMAEVVLRDRLHEITLGERVALARMAPREVIKALRGERDERVFAALLENPRLTEEDLVLVASSLKTPPAILQLVGRSERWTLRGPVKLALLRNPSTPFAVAGRLLTTLPEHELRLLAELPAAPAAVRATAARLREARARAGPSARPERI